MASHRRMTAWLVTVTVVYALSFAPGASAEAWKRAHVDALPDQAFAVVHVRGDGTRARHLPHHDAGGRVDVRHLRSAVARLGQVRWKDPADAAEAQRHLLQQSEALGARRAHARPANSADGP